jgi:hypothetical protein
MRVKELDRHLPRTGSPRPGGNLDRPWVVRTFARATSLQQTLASGTLDACSSKAGGTEIILSSVPKRTTPFRAANSVRLIVATSGSSAPLIRQAEGI